MGGRGCGISGFRCCRLLSPLKRWRSQRRLNPLRRQVDPKGADTRAARGGARHTEGNETRRGAILRCVIWPYGPTRAATNQRRAPAQISIGPGNSVPTSHCPNPPNSGLLGSAVEICRKTTNTPAPIRTAPETIMRLGLLSSLLQDDDNWVRPLFRGRLLWPNPGPRRRFKPYPPGLPNFRTKLSPSPMAAYLSRSCAPRANVGGKVHTPFG